MTCYTPKLATFSYYQKIDEKTGEIYKSKHLKFLSPDKLTDETPYQENVVAIPCGKCVGCRIDKANDWATRATIEAMQYKDNCFLTLTYNNENLPKNRTLVKRDLQLFWKRLRKTGAKIRYIACGEYGPKTLRPHYHAIIFNYFPKDATTFGKNYKEDDLKTSKTISNLWGKGFVVVARANYKTAAYVARYCVKKAYGIEMKVKHNREPEFIIASKKPAIGTNALTNTALWEKIRRNNGLLLKIDGKVITKKIPSITRKKWRELYDREDYYNWTETRARAQKECARTRDTSDNYYRFQKKLAEILQKKYKILDNARKII